MRSASRFALSIGIAYAQQLKGEYKIGVLEPLTGNLAVQGKLHLEGYEIMRDLINSRFGGVMGRKLVLVVGDAPDPTAAASEATRLATRERVKIITGTFSSTLCGAASEAAARQNVIYWETSCVDPRFTRRGLKNVFRTEIDGVGFGWYNVEFMAKYLAPRLGKKPSELRIAYIAEDSSYGQGVTEAARERAKKEFGMQEVALEYYTFTTNDLTPVILKLKNARPDVLHHIARDQDAILFWRQAREQNFEVQAVVHAGATGYGNPGFGKALGNEANGPFALSEPGTGFLVDKLRPDGQKIERAFREAIKAKTGSDDPTGGHQLAARRPLAAQARARRGQDRRPGQIPRRGDEDGPARRQPGQRLGRQVRGHGPELQRARPALHAAVAERTARHGVAGGVHEQPREVGPARAVEPAQIAP